MTYEAALCPAVAGVQFEVDYRHRRLRGLVLADALQLAFGAGDDPADWLHAFETHRQRILARAAQRYRRQPELIVVLRTTDFIGTERPAPSSRSALL